MKKLCLLLLTISSVFGIVTSYSQGLTNVIVEKYYVSDANDASGSIGTLPAGSVTYRIYAEMLPGYKFQAAFGINSPLHELRLATTTTFFNNEDRGGKTANDINKNYLKNNTVMLDSWLSVGAGSSGHFGILKGEDTNGAITNADGLLQNNDANAGIPVKTEDGLITGAPQTVTTVGIDNIINVFDNVSQTGNLFSTTNGSWASLNGSVGPTADNRVLIAQITTDGVFTFELNIQIGTPGGDVEQYVAKNPLGNEMQRNFLTYSSTTSNTSPIISITSPADSSVFNYGDVANITAQSFDPDGTVSSVEFFVDGVSIGVDNSSPYSSNYTCKSGYHALTAVATDNKGAKTTSKVITIKVGPEQVKELGIRNNELEIYPNPVSSLLIVNSNSQISNLNIYDLTGKIIYQKLSKHNSTTGSQLSINMSSLANGLYILELRMENGEMRMKKIVKN